MKRALVKKEKVEIPSVPPGFVSLTSFTLRRIDDSEAVMSSVAPGDASGSQSLQIGTKCNISNDARSPMHRPWINYSDCDGRSEDSDPEQHSEYIPSEPLPKGVLCGCSECSNCQKVIAKWHPEDACRPVLEEAPTFYPTEEEFEDTLKYIASIQPRAEKYGICRIVPPPSWDPPCSLKEKNIWENSKFCTRIQQIDKLQNRNSKRKMSRSHRKINRKRRRCLRMGMQSGDTIELNKFESCNENGWFGFEPGPEFTLNDFEKYANDFKSRYFREAVGVDSERNKDMNPYNWEPSVEDIEGEYWRMVEKPTEEIEVLYGADVETGAFGSGFPKVSSSMKSSHDVEKYLKSGWNLNNVPRLPGSVLSFESSDISGVIVPWLYVGMCFSSFCWHVEDHHLYSLNYMHWGSPKLWYGVPGRYASKLEMAMKKCLPDLFEEQSDLLHKLVTQLSPSILIKEGVPVFRCVQNPREFVLTFPRAYHSGFNSGFNCAEAVNVGPLDWLPHGQIVVNLYCQQGRKTTISHDKLLLGAAREAVRAQWKLQFHRQNTFDNLRWRDVCGRDGILAKALKVRVEMECRRREHLCPSRLVKMDSSFDVANERECIVCFYDLHLSAVGCPCCPEKFTCIIHAKKLCSCPWSGKIFLYRYDISELNILVEALEGKLSAIYRWAKLDLGLVLSSHSSKGNSSPGLVGKPFYSLGAKHESNLLNAETLTCIPRSPVFHQEIKSPAVYVPSLIEQKVKESITPNVVSSTWMEDDASLLQSDKTYKPVLTSRDGKELCLTDKLPYKNTSAAQSSRIRVADIPVLHPNLFTPPNRQLCEEEKFTGIQHSTSIDQKSPSCHSPVPIALPIKKSVTVENISNKCLSSRNENIIVISDDESEEAGRFSPDKAIRDIHVVDKKNYPFHPENLKVEDHGKGDKCMDTFMLPSDTKVGSFPKPNNWSKDEKNLEIKYNQTCMAKVVPRMNYNVEVLEFGVVLSGNLWSSSQFIFPKGFRSRVSYISMLNPAETCYYVSEILDAGLSGPLFMVKVEQCPSEVFIHMSPTKCWDMVRLRVNEEIVRQRNLHRVDLPYVQPPGTIDGLEMFGFYSPTTIKGIEAIDKSFLCIEYWKCRPRTQDSNQLVHENLGDIDMGEKDQSNNQETKSVTNDGILKGLFRKANLEELHSLYDILSEIEKTTDRRLVIQFLIEEIQNCKK